MAVLVVSQVAVLVVLPGGSAAGVAGGGAGGVARWRCWFYQVAVLVDGEGRRLIHYRKVPIGSRAVSQADYIL